MLSPGLSTHSSNHTFNPSFRNRSASDRTTALSFALCLGKRRIRTSAPYSCDFGFNAWGDTERNRMECHGNRGVQRQEEHPEARPGVGFVHSSLRQDASLEAGEGANRLTKHAPATRGRKNDGSTLANLPAGDTPRVSLRSPVREYCPPGSVRGAPGNRCPDLDDHLNKKALE